MHLEREMTTVDIDVGGSGKSQVGCVSSSQSVSSIKISQALDTNPTSRQHKRAYSAGILSPPPYVSRKF